MESKDSASSAVEAASGLEKRPRPARGELFADAGARAVWAALLSLDEAELHLVYRELQSRLAAPQAHRSKTEERVAQAIAALNEAADLLESEDKPRLVSIESYRRLRAEHPESNWPPDGSLRRWLGGSWNQALKRAALKPVVDGDALVRQLGATFTRAECRAAIAAYVEETGDPRPSVARYLAWARRPDVQTRPGRRPLSEQPYLRLWGRWALMLENLGFTASSGEPALDEELSLPGRVQPRSGEGYTDGEVGAALREVARRLGQQTLTRADYDRERALIQSEEAKAGLPLRPFPSTSLIALRFPIWDTALIAAGLEARNGRHQKRRSRRPGEARISDAEIKTALRQAYREAAQDEKLTGSGYEAWRKEQRAKGSLARLPGRSCLRQRYGSFDGALEAALASDDEPPQLSDPASKTFGDETSGAQVQGGEGG
jgi:hypothetical protein